jgi:hypothetical protein
LINLRATFTGQGGLPTAKDLGRVFYDHYHSYGLLMDSFEYKTANVLEKAS